MKNQFILTSIFLFLSLIAFAQPELTLWRVSPEHYKGHDHDYGDEQRPPDFYELGGYYYYIHKPGSSHLYMHIRNDGDETLYLGLPLKLTANTSPELKITEQPASGSLEPGESTGFILTYENQGSYRDGVRGAITFESNTPKNFLSGFSIGAGPRPPQDIVCTCNGTDTMTIDLFNSWLPISEESDEANGIMLTPLLQDKVIIHSGPCTETSIDDCPSPEDVECIYSPFSNRLNSVRKGTPIFAVGGFPYYFDVQDGYCPCELVGPLPCIQGPPELNGPVTSVPPPCPYFLPEDPVCPSESFTVNLSSNCENPCDDIKHEGNSAEFVEHEVTWCVDGFATITQDPSDPGMATVTDWKFGDFVFVKITDPEDGCMAVIPFPIGDLPGQRGESNSLVNIDIICTEGTYQLCFPIDDFLMEQAEVRNKINSRGEMITWETDGEGVFGQPFAEDPFDHCIEITGAAPGDRIYATSDDGTDPETGCPPYAIYIVPELPSRDCEILANENLRFNPGRVEIDDPCNCGDPLNFYDEEADIYYFHDVFVIQTDDPTASNLSVSLGALMNWYVVEGGVATLVDMPFDVDDNSMLDTNPDDNIIEIDFWHREGEQATAGFGFDYDNLGGAATGFGAFPSSICSDRCPVLIPTMGQWGVLILLLLIIVVGVVMVKRKGVVMD